MRREQSNRPALLLTVRLSLNSDPCSVDEMIRVAVLFVVAFVARVSSLSVRYVYQKTNHSFAHENTRTRTQKCQPCQRFLHSVFGGTGFVGSRVAKLLVEGGADVTSLSKSGSPPSWAKDSDWIDSVQWKSVDFLSADDATIDEIVGNPDCVVSCLGVIGTDPEILRKGNGDANKNAFRSAERGGNLKRAAFVSVSSEVDACKDSWLPEFFKVRRKDRVFGFFRGHPPDDSRTKSIQSRSTLKERSSQKRLRKKVLGRRSCALSNQPSSTAAKALG